MTTARRLLALLSVLLCSPLQAAVFDPPSATSLTNHIFGNTPSGLSWEYVASGSALPVRTSGTQNGAPGPVAYYNVDSGQLQIDPKGWSISLFNFTYTTGTVNVSGSTSGPLTYASGTDSASATVSGPTGLANQRTLPAGDWTFRFCNPARVAGTVSLTRSPTLAASYDVGNGAGGNFPYAKNPLGESVTAGWMTQPWSFPYAGDDAGSSGLINSGSIAAGLIDAANWKVFGRSGNANADVLGYGNYCHVFSYTIDGITGGQVGAIVPTSGGTPLSTSTYIDIVSGTVTQVDAGYGALSGGRTFVKTGAGGLVLNQPNATINPMQVSEGTLVLANAHALPNSRISVANGATLSLGAGVATTIAHLTLSASSVVDLASGRLTIASGLSASQAVDEMRKGRDEGTWQGVYGITSRVAAADVSQGLKRTVGWLENSDGSVTIAYAAPGDGTLDGLVDIMDVAYFLVGGRFDSGQQATWREGDYNYDGIVDILDVKDLLGADLYDAGPYNAPAGTIAAVPEPSTIGLMGVGAGVAGLVAARRKRAA
jgi:hypothetical protein